MDQPDRGRKSVIGRGLVIEGNIRCQGSLLVEGEVTGNISGLNITIGSTGTVIGDIAGKDLVVEGRLTGNVEAQSVSILAKGIVSGDVAYGSLTIEHGARYEGVARKGQKKSGQSSD